MDVWKELELKFTSSNDIPVSDVRITRDEMLIILDEIAKLQCELINLKNDRIKDFKKINKLHKDHKIQNNCIADQHDEIRELKAHIDRVKNAEICPNYGCGNSGCIPNQISEDEWEPEQCQWCYVTKNSLFNIINETPKQSLIKTKADAIRETVSEIKSTKRLPNFYMELMLSYADKLESNQQQEKNNGRSHI